MTPWRMIPLLGVAAWVGCQPADSSLGALDDTANSQGSGTTDHGDGDPGATHGTATTGADATAGGDGLIKLDVGAAAFDLGGGSDCSAERPCVCGAVDILFVVDNSAPMAAHQQALVAAFPAVLDALAEALPPGTSLHLGVTSTTMGHSATGVTTDCAATGDRGQAAEAFYATPDARGNGLSDAQGRLSLAQGKPFFEVLTDASANELAAAAVWFGQAASLGEGGSEIEMSAAAAAWATDPANDASNSGFVRDQGAVLALVFVQDEPDQTPAGTVDDLLARIVAAKGACGGARCVVAGGFVDTACLPEVPLGGLIDAFGADGAVVPLPPVADADALTLTLRDVFVPALAARCETLVTRGPG